jgi:uncharacterized integral membrane protein
MQKSFVITLIFAVFIALFAVMNSAVVNINLFFASFQLSQAVVILISAVIGAICVYALSFVQIFSLKKQIKSLSKKLEMAERFNQVDGPEIKEEEILNAAVDSLAKPIEVENKELPKE